MEKKKLGCLLFVSILSLIIFGSCRRVDRLEFSIERVKDEAVDVTVCLIGTFREDKGGTVENPYYLQISLCPVGTDIVQIQNLKLRQMDRVRALELMSPVLGEVIDANSGKERYIKSEKFRIEYEDSYVSFDLARNNGIHRKVEVCLRKMYTRRWTMLWWEKMSSV